MNRKFANANMFTFANFFDLGGLPATGRLVTPNEALDIVCRNVVREAACSQRQLAKRCAMPLSMINKVYQHARGKRMKGSLTLETVVRLADGLDVHPGDLFRKAIARSTR